MIETTIMFLPYLAIAVGVNILLGMYHNIENLHEEFSFRKLIAGVSKVIILAISFIGVAFVFDRMSLELALGDYELKPDLVLYSAILVYIGKDIENLMKILGVKEIISKVKTKAEITIER